MTLTRCSCDLFNLIIALLPSEFIFVIQLPETIQETLLLDYIDDENDGANNWDVICLEVNKKTLSRRNT